MELKITLDNQGKVMVYGPLNDKILCYGLLQMAKDVIRDCKPGAIEPAKIMPVINKM